MLDLMMTRNSSETKPTSLRFGKGSLFWQDLLEKGQITHNLNAKHVQRGFTGTGTGGTLEAVFTPRASL